MDEDDLSVCPFPFREAKDQHPTTGLLASNLPPLAVSSQKMTFSYLTTPA